MIQYCFIWYNIAFNDPVSLNNRISYHMIQYCIIRYKMILFIWYNILGIVIRYIIYQQLHPQNKFEWGRTRFSLYISETYCCDSPTKPVECICIKRCIIPPILVKIKPISFSFVNNNLKIFVLALQNEQNPLFYGLRFAANSGN